MFSPVYNPDQIDLASTPVISVVIICNHMERRMRRVIDSAKSGAIEKEVILVLSEDIAGRFDHLQGEEIKVVVSPIQGRGYACYEGAKAATGKVILFLHADTLLPSNWDNLILQALNDTRYLGGGFSLQYDPANWFLRNVSPYINIYSRIFKEVWGDRGLFISREALIPHLDTLLVPIMEDIKLSRIINSQGKMAILREKVVTSGDHFKRKGCWNHILSILLYRILYTFGISEDRIYKWYYSGVLKQ